MVQKCLHDHPVYYHYFQKNIIHNSFCQVSVDNAAGLSRKRRGLPETWISGGQMSGEDDDTDAGSSVQIYRKKYNKISNII